MKREDVELAVSWAADEGWNPGLHDASCFYTVDPQGFFIGERNGEPIGCISAVAYDDAFGFIGFYIVKPAYRGEQYGVRLGIAALDYLGERNVGIDGVLKQIKNYEKLSDFHLAYRNIRFEGKGEGSIGKQIVPLSEVPFEQVFAYDCQCFPVPRETFLRCWINMKNAISVARTDSGKLQGFGTIRACRNGYKIGPLFADNEQIAEEIYLSLARLGKGEPVYLDVPEVNSPAVALAEKYGMKKVFETARMYTKEAPKIRLDKIFGVTTFELG
jgi:ribosomal protein S18 acetylase RimI-like enzyme